MWKVLVGLIALERRVSHGKWSLVVVTGQWDDIALTHREQTSFLSISLIIWIPNNAMLVHFDISERAITSRARFSISLRGSLSNCWA